MSRRSKRGNKNSNGMNTDAWLMTYSDMISLLLIFFIVMYSMSHIDLEKFKALARQLGPAFNENIKDVRFPDGPTEESITEIGELEDQVFEEAIYSKAEQEFDKVYQMLQKTISEKGYEDKISLEKGDTYIMIRFNDSVLFLPDQYIMTFEGADILVAISESLQTVNPYIQEIQINGHTAFTGRENTSDFFAWQLSANRSIAVLSHLVQYSKLEQRKMFIAGFSHYDPIADNSTEEGRAYNRRVDIKISRLNNTALSQLNEAPPGTTVNTVTQSAGAQKQ